MVQAVERGVEMAKATARHWVDKAEADAVLRWVETAVAAQVGAETEAVAEVAAAVEAVEVAVIMSAVAEGAVVSSAVALAISASSTW